VGQCAFIAPAVLSSAASPPAKDLDSPKVLSTFHMITTFVFNDIPAIKD
jgi:hypothetical protein